MTAKERAKALRSTPEAKAKIAENRRKRNAKRTPEEVAEVNRKARAWAAIRNGKKDGDREAILAMCSEG